MPNCDQLLEQARNAPANVRFNDICQLAECYGFVFTRQKGSHRMYKPSGYPKLMNFQMAENGKAKAYQVRQLLNVIEELTTSNRE